MPLYNNSYLNILKIKTRICFIKAICYKSNANNEYNPDTNNTVITFYLKVNVNNRLQYYKDLMYTIEWVSCILLFGLTNLQRKDLSESILSLAPR